MSVARQIKAPIAHEMRIFEERFHESMKSNTPLLNKISHYIIKRKGKQVRPIFVFLSAKICGEINDSTYSAASLIELLHTATLVHDDVVDDSYQRRGFFSLNALWKNKIAVLVGDYLLSRGLLMSIDNGEFDLLKMVSHAVREMSEGELLQMEKARKLNITEDIYYEIIRQKTASLIAACCASGASSVKADEEQVQLMHSLGENVGMAFQIKDDLFDYGNGAKTGKPSGIDIKERKLTLPLIQTLNNVSKTEKRQIINILKNHNEDKKRIDEIIHLVMRGDGITYAVNKMHEFADKSMEILNQFDTNPSQEALKRLITYTVNRTK